MAQNVYTYWWWCLYLCHVIPSHPTLCVSDSQPVCHEEFLGVQPDIDFTVLFAHVLMPRVSQIVIFRQVRGPGAANFFIPWRSRDRKKVENHCSVLLVIMTTIKMILRETLTTFVDVVNIVDSWWNRNKVFDDWQRFIVESQCVTWSRVNPIKHILVLNSSAARYVIFNEVRLQTLS